MKSIDPRLHAAVVSYFGGIARHTRDRILQDHIIENAENGDYDTAHKLSLEYRLLDPKSPYARTDHFPLEQFHRFDALKNQEENGATKSMKPRTHAGARSVSINNGQWKKIAEEKWSKLDNHAINEIASAVAEHGFDTDKKGGPLDVSHLVQYAREKTSKSMYNRRNNSLRLLQFGLSKASIKGLEGTNRNPEAQRKQDMDTGFFRKPKTYQGTHPHHDVIYSYFNHFSRKLDDDAKATILHDARLGEYGSAQRKLARRNDKLPAGLDGLKFGDLQINMIKEMREEGIL